MQQYTLDPNAKKLNRGVLFGLLERWAVHDETLSKREKDSVLLSLAPMPRTPKNAMEWLAKATAKKDSRSYLESIYVSSGVGYASNGHFGLSANAAGFDDGFYCPRTQKMIDLNASYPVESLEQTFEGEAFEICNLAPERVYVDTLATFLYRIGDHYYQCKYVDIARSWTTDPKFYFTEDGKLIMKDYYGRRAVIMRIITPGNLEEGNS